MTKNNRCYTSEKNHSNNAFELRQLAQGEVARVLAEHPNSFDELTEVEGEVVIVVRDELNLPVDDNEFLLTINCVCPDVVDTVGEFLGELSVNHDARIFRDININTFFITADLGWKEATTLLQYIGGRFGLSAVK